jgi:serine O-acetyltransferase
MDLIKADAIVYGSSGTSPAFYFAAMLGLNRFSAVFLFRVASALYEKGRLGRILSSAITRLNSVWNSTEFSPIARIGPGLHVPHPQGVVCGAITAGANLSIRQHVTLGLSDMKLPYRDPANFPTLGDDVQIAPGTAILGPVRIGDRAVIGAHSVVLGDIPTGGVVAGNPARLVWRKRPTIAKAAPSEPVAWGSVRQSVQVSDKAAE